MANQASPAILSKRLYRLSLTLMQIRQTNLPVSLHLSETYRFYAPRRSCASSSVCFIFGIILLFLPLSYIDFSSRSRSIPHYAVIGVVFLHYSIFI